MAGGQGERKIAAMANQGILTAKGATGKEGSEENRKTEASNPMFPVFSGLMPSFAFLRCLRFKMAFAASL